jgi:tetratricopeptide (TPR) repeat protein
LGPRNPALAATLDNLAVAYASQREFGQAEALYRRSLALREKVTVESLNNRAMALEEKGDHPAAERLYRQAIELADRIPVLKETANVGEAEILAVTLENYSALLRKLKRDAEAARVEARLKAIATALRK